MAAFRSMQHITRLVLNFPLRVAARNYIIGHCLDMSRFLSFCKQTVVAITSWMGIFSPHDLFTRYFVFRKALRFLVYAVPLVASGESRALPLVALIAFIDISDSRVSSLSRLYHWSSPCQMFPPLISLSFLFWLPNEPGTRHSLSKQLYLYYSHMIYGWAGPSQCLYH